MLATMTSPQLSELEAFWTVEGGWGDYKQDYRIGQMCATLANIHRDSKRKPNPYSIDEFALRPRQANRTDPKEAEKRIRHSLDGLAGVNGEKKKRRRK